MNASTLTALLANFSNATMNATPPVDCRAWSGSSSLLPDLTCDAKSVEVLRSILLTCATVFVIVLVVLTTLVAALMLQIRKLSMLTRTLRAATGNGAAEVCSGLLLTAPELRSSFQAKTKRSKKSTVKFTDTEDTTCATSRDVDEEEL
jgi:hypothetical protein